MLGFSDNFKINRLAQKMREGDKAAAGKIFDYFSPLIFRYLMKRISHKETAEELTQEIFLKIIKKIESFDKSQGNFSAWIWKIVKNSLIDFYRQKKEIVISNFLDTFKNIAYEDNYLENKLKVADVLRRNTKTWRRRTDYF